MKTFKEISEGYPSNSISPRTNFLLSICKLTNKSLSTVKGWAYCDMIPDKTAQMVLAKHFKCKPEELFPPKNHESSNM